MKFHMLKLMEFHLILYILSHVMLIIYIQVDWATVAYPRMNG